MWWRKRIIFETNFEWTQAIERCYMVTGRYWRYECLWEKRLAKIEKIESFEKINSWMGS